MENLKRFNNNKNHMNVQTIFLRITLILFLAFTIPMMKAQKGLELETLENLIKESLVTDFLTSATFVEDDTIFVYIKIKKSESELRRYLSERNISHYDKEKFINLIDSIGFNSEPYKDIDYNIDVYSAENPIFSFQKGWIASSIGTDGRYNDIIDVKVTYLSDNGKPVHQQLISSKLLAIVRQLKQNNFAVKTISKLIANKTGIDAGVLGNKKMVPYQVDFMTEMTDIELTDSTYIYKLVIPQFTSVLLSESEYKEIGNSLEEQLGSYVDSMPFFKMDGASLFGIEIIYSYKADETGNELVTYHFNPYTKRCVIEMPSSNSENMDKYNTDLQSNPNSKTLYSFQINGKSGYFDDQCNIVVPPKFDQAGTFLDGMGMVQVGSKFGYVNIKGEFAIEPQFEYAWYFSDGLASVQKNGKWGVINKNGEFVIEPVYDYADGGSEGAVTFKKE